MEKDEALLLRADLLQAVKGLELQRAALLSIVNRIEKKYHIEKGTGNGQSKSITSSSKDESRENTKHSLAYSV